MILSKTINKTLMMLPTPMNINYWWNSGSMVGMCLMLQLITGIILSMQYTSQSELSFQVIIHIMNDSNSGWIMRLCHMNGASLFFICMYSHMGKNLFYSLYMNKMMWFSGSVILLLSMATAFLGYVLPWGQMSFWGATVITNLASAIPFVGSMLVEWVWGGYTVSNPTLNRFFSLHFLIPFIIAMLSMIHLMILHIEGSNNPMGIKSESEKIPFHMFFTIKDMVSLMIMMMIYFMLNMINPFIINDTENFIMANPMVTPTHIQPEWYYLFAYAILRAIPSKLGGVLALLMSILILAILPLINMKEKTMKNSMISKKKKMVLLNVMIMLTWLGAKPVETPFIEESVVMTIAYFSILLFKMK